MSIRAKYDEAGSTGSSDFDFEPIPKGRYVCELLDASQRQRQFGSMEWETEINWRVVDGQFAGRRIRQKCVHRESMAWLMRQTWEAVGLGGQPWDGLDPAASDAEIWGNWTHQVHMRAGARCSLKVDVNSWTSNSGEARFENTVNGLSPAPASASNGPSPQYYAQPAPGGNPNIAYGVANAPPQGAPMDDPSNGRPW